MIRHHRLIEAYLSEALGMPERPRPRGGRGARALHLRGAGGLIAAKLGEPSHDPHGSPIPGPDLRAAGGGRGELMRTARRRSASARCLGAGSEAVWERAMTPEGINDELGPLLRMTVPRGARRASTWTRSSRGRLGRSWILLFGFLPVDYDEIGLERIEPGAASSSARRCSPSGSGSTSGRSSRLGAGAARSPTGSPGSRGCRCPGRLLRPLFGAVFRHRHRRLRRHFGGDGAAGQRLGFLAMPLAEDFQRSSTRCRRTGPTSRSTCGSTTRASYIDTAVTLSQVNAQPYSEAEWHWRLLVAHSFGHAAAAETVKGVLAKLDAEGVAGEMQVREVREGRSEVVQMWGRPESVREEFRQRRSI